MMQKGVHNCMRACWLQPGLAELDPPPERARRDEG